MDYLYSVYDWFDLDCWHCSRPVEWMVDYGDRRIAYPCCCGSLDAIDAQRGARLIVRERLAS